jgi:hypothetical protein
MAAEANPRIHPNPISPTIETLKLRFINDINTNYIGRCGPIMDPILRSKIAEVEQFHYPNLSRLGNFIKRKYDEIWFQNTINENGVQENVPHCNVDGYLGEQIPKAGIRLTDGVQNLLVNSYGHINQKEPSRNPPKGAVERADVTAHFPEYQNGNIPANILTNPEVLKTAAIREFHEETGINLRDFNDINYTNNNQLHLEMDRGMYIYRLQVTPEIYDQIVTMINQNKNSIEPHRSADVTGIYWRKKYLKYKEKYLKLKASMNN